MELELAATLLLLYFTAEEWLMVQKLYTCKACQIYTIYRFVASRPDSARATSQRLYIRRCRKLAYAALHITYSRLCDILKSLSCPLEPHEGDVSRNGSP